jgi:CheY-like chemotaxis protein
MRAVGIDVNKSDLEQLNMLIVDDNPHMRRLVQTMLHAFGIRNIQESSSAEEVFEELGHFNAHVIVTDWKMKPMDGIMLSDTLQSGENSPIPLSR